MILKIIDAEYKGNHSILCFFNTGERRLMDFTQLLQYPAFQELKDEKKFRQFGLDNTLFWANGADIAPEYLLENGSPV
ncbi:MAG: DUF2442 domain-containing protein [Bacteroidales bacterium]|nr:DUF2442 domain-containing protein [Bacteroidales bacterium]